MAGKQGIVGVVLAAGAGSRFGGGKQLAELDGRPLLEHALAAAAAAPELERRFVVLGANSERILAAVDLHGHEPVLACDWSEGLSASLRAGVGAARDVGANAVLITLGDQPRIGPPAIARVVAARGGPTGQSRAIRASYEGKPGHPTLLEESLFDTVLALSGDEGARGVFKREFTHLVPCEDIALPTDVDVVADLKALRASPNPPSSERDGEPPGP